jgi:subtilisin family serine protease
MRLARLVAVVLLPALLGAPVALGAQLHHSALAPLPSVLPPTPLPGGMHWARRAPAPSPTRAYRDGAAIGVVAGVDGRRLAAGLGLRVLTWLPRLRLVEVAGPPARLAALADRGDARIRYVEPVTTATPAHVRNDPLTYEIDPSTGVPYEWAFDAVGVDQALNLTRGDPSILVGVVDSGVASVPDLTGKIAETFWDHSAAVSAVDTLGHGTFVSSIIAARNDDGSGLAGFCGACRLAVFKASPLTNVEVAEGIQTLTDAHVRVLNLSFVLDKPSQPVIDALDYALAAGVLVVAASGNDGSRTVDFPASALQPPSGVAAGGLAVGASDASGRRASFSNWGSQLSLLAPGTFDSQCTSGIIGAIPAMALDFEDSGDCALTVTHANGVRYAYASGTSFAAPEVAGVAALLWSLKPSLTSVQLATVLEQSATRPEGSGWTAATGWGVLNAAAAAQAVAGRSTADAIALSRLHVTRPRTAGARVVAGVGVHWADGTAVGVGASPLCAITVGGNGVPVFEALEKGVLTCTFSLPAGSAGKQVRGVLSVTSPTAPTVRARFRFAVPKAKGR